MFAIATQFQKKIVVGQFHYVSTFNLVNDYIIQDADHTGELKT